MASILLSIVFYSFPYVFHISTFYNVFFTVFLEGSQKSKFGNMKMWNKYGKLMRPWEKLSKQQAILFPYIQESWVP